MYIPYWAYFYFPPSYFQCIKSNFTRSSNISRWCTWIVISVSYLMRSMGLRSFVVMSIRVFKRSKKNWFVFGIIFLSYFALVKASSASLVQIIWIPNKPTLGKKIFPEKLCRVQVRFFKKPFLLIDRAGPHMTQGEAAASGSGNGKGRTPAIVLPFSPPPQKQPRWGRL